MLAAAPQHGTRRALEFKRSARLNDTVCKRVLDRQAHSSSVPLLSLYSRLICLHAERSFHKLLQCLTSQLRLAVLRGQLGDPQHSLERPLYLPGCLSTAG